MDNRFDFDKTGKRMPYTVPDGFFDELERNVRRQTAPRPTTSAKRKPLFRHVAMLAAASAAAAIALPMVFSYRPAPQPAYTMENVEQAFADLSGEDQAYILEVYNEDIFINQ